MILEEALKKEREETINQILNNMTNGVLVSDCNDVILMINNIGFKKLALSSSVYTKKVKINKLK